MLSQPQTARGGYQNASSERSFLGKSETWQGRTGRALRNLDAGGGRIGSGHLRGAQHGVLGEDLAVHLGDKGILAALVLAPDLAELNGLDRHVASSSSRVMGAEGGRQFIAGHCRL